MPLTTEQIKEHINVLDSSLSCKDLRAIVKDIISPPIETTAEDSTESTEYTESTESTEPQIVTDKDRILKMLEICSEMENEEIKSKIINVFQKSLKALEK